MFKSFLSEAKFVCEIIAEGSLYIRKLIEVVNANKEVQEVYTYVYNQHSEGFYAI